MDAWDVWAAGVLAGVHAQANATNIDTLWAWSNAESGAFPMRWNNPLNTTERMPGSVSMNSVGVQRFLSVQDGITATVATLLNGYYPMILDHLRRSIPRQQWQDACANLGTWGTGCAWLTRNYGSPAGFIGDNDMTPEEHGWLQQVYEGMGVPPGAQSIAVHLTQIDQEIAALKAQLGTPGVTVQLTAGQVQQVLDSLSASVQAAIAKLKVTVAAA